MISEPTPHFSFLFKFMSSIGSKVSPMMNPLRPSAEEKTNAVEQKLRDVAQMYEKHFMNEMVKSMRSTVSESGFVKVNQGERIFREQLDQEYVGAWSKKGGIGLSNLIYDQLIEKYGAQLGLRPKSSQGLSRPQGPLPLNSDSDLKIQNQKQGSKEIFQIEAKSPAEGSSEGVLSKASLSVSAPWSGKLINKINLAADEYFLKIQHENGLQSELKWNGLLGADLELGKNLTEGQQLGHLSPDSQRVTWAISQENVSE